MWTQDELTKIGDAEELELSSLQEDGTLGKPVTIWVVRIDDELYVRAYRGQKGVWYQKTKVKNKGQISADGITKIVDFVDVSVDEELNKKIDEIYKEKYKKHGAYYVDPMVTDDARSTTIQLIPQ